MFQWCTYHCASIKGLDMLTPIFYAATPFLLPMQNYASVDTYSKLGILIGVSLALGWWCDTDEGRFITLSILACIGGLLVKLTAQSGLEALVIIGLFTFPAFITSIIKRFMYREKELSDSDVEHIQQEIAEYKSIELVQKIDNMLNCVIGVNNVWVQKNWSSQNDEEKIQFIESHRKIFNEELIYVENVGDIIELLQKTKRSLNSTPHSAS